MAIERVAQEWTTYGYGRITFQLRRQNSVLNSKRLRRLMKEMGLLRPRCKGKKRTTNSHHPLPRYPNLTQGLKVERPDQVRVCEITYIRLRVEFVYLSVIMDVFSRSIRGWHLGRDLDFSLSLTALSEALQRGCPDIRHSDQGVQYACSEYVQTLLAAGVRISMAELGDPTKNGYAERLIRTLRRK